MMIAFLSEFTRNLDQVYTILVMDAEQMEQPRQYRVPPRSVLLLFGSSMLLTALLVASLIVFTPLRELIPGYSTDDMRRSARLNTLRLTALQDSLEVQELYVNRLRALMTGQVDSTQDAEAAVPDPGLTISGELAEVVREPSSKNWSDHEQPALSMVRMPLRRDASAGFPEPVPARPATLQFPVLPPVSGFLTRGFDARTGHYAADIAVEEGAVVRAIADGHVVFADWTQDGGYAIAVQHADGYLSVYKHNQRLLKHVGDRVHDRDAIAVSGNSGEVTTGPHLHFELWHNGLAQDPNFFLIGW